MSDITLVLADDHALIRAGYRSLLADVNGITLVGEATDGNEAIKVVSELKPNVIILDITMPNRSGLEAIEEIKRNSPKTKIMMLSMHKEEAYIVQSISLGADGYLVKDTDSEKFIEAIRLVHSGEKYFGETSTKVLLNSYVKKLMDPLPSLITYEDKYNLSERELEILHLVINGKTSPEIAKQLFISKRTVENHRAHVMKKLNVHTMAELFSKVQTEKLLLPPPNKS